ncbi:T9SS type A sorting domain-containing protein [Flavobacterium psychrotolerans]|uniref:Secretion system C-terminal sorting domain-containing protein n=1 Tax=Flavobacterium psychrotolerans TaxID=2169410 RepID=A0A2U1JFU2_9FLAO|nr:T9SS type A sorting domain-containing protein [Flavobacterium psychrotolerans]PWA03859.1 hypothetical protein DB895_14000 [Flavobacterium psychrotolerans]
MKNILKIFLITFNCAAFGQFQDISYQTRIGLGQYSLVRSDLQTNGQLLVSSGGSIFRLNTDGTEDLSFSANIGTGFSRDPTCIKLQNDGKIIVLFDRGTPLTFNGLPIQTVIRLNSDGSYDNSFNFFIAGNQSSWFHALIQNDGKIILGSEDTILRINSNGTQDNTFSTGYSDGGCRAILDVKFDVNNKIIVGGCFSFYNKIVANGVIRLNANGTIDPTFVTGTGFTSNTNPYIRVTSIAIQSNGKYLFGGTLGSYNGNVVNNVVRINTDGSLDNTFVFNSAIFDTVTNMYLQTNGNVIVVGTKNTTINSFPVFLTSIQRFLPTGQNDGTLNISNNFTGAFDTTPFVKSLQIQNDGKLIVLGTFTKYNDVTVNGIVRLTDKNLLTNNFSLNQVIVYPNPASNLLNINNTEYTSYEIFNTAGVKIISDSLTSQHINTSLMPKGLYILLLKNDLKTTTVKFLKE